MNINYNYFHKYLDNYLHEKFPHIPFNKGIADAKCKTAVATYNEIYDKGYDERVALEYALWEILDGLEFSPFSLIMDIVNENFEEVPANQRGDFCLYIMPECSRIIYNTQFLEMETYKSICKIETEISKIILKNICHVVQ